MDLIDYSIIPDPFNPHPGDAYRRKGVSMSHPQPPKFSVGMLLSEVENTPLSIVIRRVAPTEGDSGRVWLFVDGRETYKTPAEFPIWLASIDGMESSGRVRSKPA